MSITIESILLDKINELSQELAGAKHDLQRATKEVSDLESDLHRLELQKDIIYNDRAEVTNHILDYLSGIDELLRRAEKDGCASFMEDVREKLDEWKQTYQYKL